MAGDSSSNRLSDRSRSSNSHSGSDRLSDRSRNSSNCSVSAVAFRLPAASAPAHLQRRPYKVQILHFAVAQLRGPAAYEWGTKSYLAQLATLDLPLRYTLRGSKKMLWTICVILLILWALGMVTSYTAAGLIHILLVVGLVILVIRLIQGRRIV
jgi:uncharacterized membrane protein YtjA (UPF0391 family)